MPNSVEKMTINYSPNFDLVKRDKKKIKYLIFHYTGMKSDRLALKKLTSENSKVSCHYFITKNGKLIQIVPDLYSAWHAGKSNWKKDNLLNKNSIGIEISNPGHYYGYKKFNKKQLPFNDEMLSFWNEEGFLVIEQFYDSLKVIIE